MRELNRTGTRAGLHDDVERWRDNFATYVDPPERGTLSAAEYEAIAQRYFSQIVEADAETFARFIIGRVLGINL